MQQRTNAQRVEAMAGVPLFAAMDADLRRAWLDRCLVRQYPVGANIISPCEQADRFFAILAGRVKVFQLSADGDEQIFHLYGRGATFAEAAMFTGGRFPAFAQAVEAAELLIITRAELTRAIAADPETAMHLLAGLSAKLREFNTLIEDLSLKEVPARLARVLGELADDAAGRTFRLPMTKRQLAALLGTTPETLSRSLASLRKLGAIAVDGRDITILDAAALADAADL